MENLTVIVPVYNEEKLISSSLNRLIALKKNFKILVVDDCSDDGSVEIIKSIVKKNKNIQLIEKDTNQGKGSTIVEGFKNVDTEFCTIHDADLEYFPDDLIDMHKKINKNTLVLGSRFIGDTERKNIYIRTYYANKLMSRFFSLVHNVSVSDVATCYKMFSTDKVKDLALQEKGFSIEIELLSKLLKNYENYIEVPIKYEGRSYSEGKKIKFKDGISYLINTVRYKF